MKRIVFLSLILLSFSSLFSQAYIKPYLENVLNEESENHLIPIIIKLNNQVDVRELKADLLKRNVDLNHRRQIIVSTLYRVNSEINNFDRLIENIREEQPNKISSVKKFWAVNIISCSIRKDLINTLLSSPEVEYIQYDFPVVGEKVKEGKISNSKSLTEVGIAEPGLVAVNARPMWALGYTGRNRLAMNIDTGVDSQHPSLGGRFLGHYLPLLQTWLGYENSYPYDIDQGHFHGTHTMGTMIGLDTATADTIGLAFNAFWIASDPIVTSMDDVRPLSDYFIAFQWALNPDGDTNTTSDIPDVINNSWGVDHDYWENTWEEDCNPIEYDFIEALEAVDCAIIFSNGNEGPDPTTTGMPAGLITDTLSVFAIGALDAEDIDYQIANFSSRGPSICDATTSLGIKPEVSAPGVDVRSASGNGEYRVLSGTSMASPHVSGAILLLREAFPDVTSTALKNALYQTAIDLGDVGEDNVYGRGLIDVYAAYQFLSQTYTPTPPLTNQFDVTIDSLVGNVDFVCGAINHYDIIIKNIGQTSISNFVFRVIVNADTLVEFPLNITLNTNESYTISQDLTLVDTLNNIVFEIEKEGLEEFNVYNNYRSFTVKRVFPNLIPFYEGFEDLSSDLIHSNFAIINPDYQNTWRIDETGGISGSSKSLRMPFAYYEPRNGQLDYFITGAFDIPTTGNTIMFFEHAYTQYFNSRKDSLFILVSPTCDLNSGDILYSKGGAELKSISSNLSGNFIPSSASDWVLDTVNLTAYAGQTVFVKFVAKNDQSNNLYIDELRIENGIDLGLSVMKFAKNNIYPNPTSGEVFIDNINEGDIIKISDLSGKILIQKKMTNGKINISDLENGIYFIKINHTNLGKIVLTK